MTTEIELLDGQTIKAIASAAIVADFQPTFGVGIEAMQNSVKKDQGNAVGALIERFAWVTFRGHESYQKTQGKPLEIEDHRALMEIANPRRILQAGSELIIALTGGTEKAKEQSKDKKDQKQKKTA